MATSEGSIGLTREGLANAPDRAVKIVALAKDALGRGNTNPSHNTYLWRNEAWTLAEARRVAETGQSELPLFGIPVSVKDCFDLAGSPTSCGTHFYRDLHGAAKENSWLVERLRAQGAVITGKTHLHPLAYGITGENAEYGDPLQPNTHGEKLLTGGSSSGAAASVMEGSAMAAIGTDTGGSVRVPAALCGLAGYRASVGRGDWRGGAHLAESFDTFGWLFRDLEDGPLLGSLFGQTDARERRLPKTFCVISDEFLEDCNPDVIASLRACVRELEALGLASRTIDVDWWSDSREIFAPIQASEAAGYHRGHFAEFENSIRERLEGGAALSGPEVESLRARHRAFRERMDDVLDANELLLMPAAPVSHLIAGADHSQTRVRLLRYTTPVSLAGMPAVTIPFSVDGRAAGGMQLVAAREDDARLLAMGVSMARFRKNAGQ